MNATNELPDAVFTGSLTEAATFGIAIVIIIAGLLSVFYIFYGGISFILSRGDEAAVEKSLSTVRQAVIGLLVTIIAVTLVGIVGAVFNVEILGNLRWGDVVEQIQSFLNNFEGQGQDAQPNNGLLDDQDTEASPEDDEEFITL